jgi:hypothetical protein
MQGLVVMKWVLNSLGDFESRILGEKLPKIDSEDLRPEASDL